MLKVWGFGGGGDESFGVVRGAGVEEEAVGAGYCVDLWAVRDEEFVTGAEDEGGYCWECGRVIVESECYCLCVGFVDGKVE